MHKPKRSLGQNFFADRNLAIKIVNETLKNNPDVVVEIGPGTGSFTQLLSKVNSKLICIEKDDELALFIKSSFKDVEVINSDVLKINFSELEKSLSPYNNKVCFGSLPYNISKKIIRLFIESAIFDEHYFIIQKEVAEKYTSRDKKQNILSLTASIYADAKKIFDIPPDVFRPKPKVTSSLISFTPNLKITDAQERSELEGLIRTSFSQPRRTLLNNLKGNYTFTDEEYQTSRPEDLTLDDYIKLSKSLRKSD